MGTVTVAARDQAGNTASSSVSYSITSGWTPRVPGQVHGRCLLGMSADDWATRISQTGQVYDHRVYVPSWDRSQLITKIQSVHNEGVIPYASMKMDGGVGGTWAQVAAGLLDGEARLLGQQLGTLGYPIRLGFHHEPNGDQTATSPSGTVDWAKAQTRLFNIIKPLAPNTILGPIDNGFKWSNKSQGWTDAELAIVYTDAFLASCDAIGSDCYDGSTTTSVGEMAWPKAKNMKLWADRIGWTGALDLGEWNFVFPADCQAMWDNVLFPYRDQYWMASIFNSNDNNRAGIPTPTGSWGLAPGPDGRLDAFKSIVAQSRTVVF